MLPMKRRNQPRSLALTLVCLECYGVVSFFHYFPWLLSYILVAIIFPIDFSLAYIRVLLGGAVAYEAAKAYEDHVAANGHPDSHAKAKEIFAGIAGAFIDREVESKGLDFIDKRKAKKAAEQHFDENVTEVNYIYENNNNYWSLSLYLWRNKFPD